MNNNFRFKKFEVTHQRSSMKVGTDGVLLGAWVNTNDARFILDIGTGTGLIALMLAQRTAGRSGIDAVEINEAACQDARENFSKSPWKEQLTLHQTSIQHFQSQRLYDLIVSNPPYFVDSLKPPARSRQMARHADTLTFHDLLTAAVRLIKPGGRLAVIFPVAETRLFLPVAESHNLRCLRECAVRSRFHKPVKRILMELSYSATSLKTETLCLYASGEEWTASYKQLTNDFYFKA